MSAGGGLFTEAWDQNPLHTRIKLSKNKKKLKKKKLEYQIYGLPKSVQSLAFWPRRI